MDVMSNGEKRMRSLDLRHAVEVVHGLGVQTCNMVNRHPVLGVFQVCAVIFPTLQCT